MTDTPLLTDLYQLTMAAGYWKAGMAEREAVFHLFFRKLPFSGGYAVTAGLGDAIRWLEAFATSSTPIDSDSAIGVVIACQLFYAVRRQLGQSSEYDC